MYKQSTDEEIKENKKIIDILNTSKVPESEKLQNLGLFLNRQLLTRILTLNELYKKIINVQGYILEFGVKYGQNIALFEVLRGIYEPYNYNRKIYGFDTFEGFPSVSKSDGNYKAIKVGHNNIPKGSFQELKKILNYHESNNPVSQVKTTNLIKGDVRKTLDKFLKNNPESIFAIIFFDFDLYEPTKYCLKKIKNRLSKNSLLIFDELNNNFFPGVAKAVLEELDLNSCEVQRLNLDPNISYIKI